MEIEHIKASELITNKWSGGTTTQLAIYPKNSEYKKNNFLFRLSTATVESEESEESEFTKLPEVSRQIMILDGKIKIEHQNQYTKIINKFEQDQFSGNWNTKSSGQATDFNLMTTGNTNGTIEAIIINKLTNIDINNKISFYGFYIYSGKVQILINNKVIDAKTGDFLNLFPKNTEILLKINPSVKSKIILSKIKY